jgi:defect-in-organelle-trafficking protein DotA
MRIFLGLILLLVSPLSLAAGSIFAVPNMDQSMLFLSEIFGQVGNVIGGATNGPLETVILLFNNVALVVGGFIILYAIIVSTVNTAHDGELLGKKWSSVWIPLRMAAGFAMLLPVKAGGYAIIQVIIMWIVVQGVGAADYLWNQYLKNVMEGNATPQVPYVSQQVMPAIIQIFKNASCTYSLALAQNQLEQGVQTQPSTSSIFYPSSDASNGTAIKFGITNPNQPAICGTVELTAPQKPSGVGQQGSFNTNNTAMGNVANYVPAAEGVSQITNAFTNYGNYGSLDDVYAYRKAMQSNQVLISITQTLAQAANYYVNTSNYCNLNTDKNCIQEVQRQILNAAQNYSAQSTGANAPIVKGQMGGGGLLTKGTQGGLGDTQQLRQSLASNASVAIMGDLNQARQYGWLYAGTYYLLLSKITAETTPNVNAPKVNTPNLGAINNYASSQQYSDTQQITQICSGPNLGSNSISATTANNAGAILVPCIPKDLNVNGPAQTFNVTYTSNNGTGILSPLIGAINSMFEDIFNWFLQVITSTSSNPVVGLATMGQTIVVTVASTFMLFGGLVVGINAGTSWIPFVGSDISSSIEIALDLFVLPAMGLLGMTMGFGAMVGYYMPLIPYILFTAGSLAWLILVIEAMVAGPILALGIVHPEGQHDIWGRSEKGVMLLLSVFLRPMLMIIGFIAASLLVYIAFQILNGGFKVAISFLSMSVFGPFTMFFTLITYFSLATYLMQQCFKLIHKIPDQVLRWIGETPEQTGQEADQEVSQGGQKVSGQAEGGAKAGAEAVKDERNRALQAKAMEAAFNASQGKQGGGENNKVS